MKKQYRQGDVLIERVRKHTAPRERLVKRIVLAHGEATGHAHAIEDETTEAWRDDKSESLVLNVAAPTEVRHQEHAPIPLEKGTYRVSRQREYQPGEMIRNVAD